MDFEATPHYELTVEVTDDGAPALGSQATLSIHLRDVNEAPVVSDATFTISERSPLGTVVGQVQASDPDAGERLSYAITTGNEWGVFALDPLTGVLTVASRAALNHEVTPEFVLTVEVVDHGTPALRGTGTVTVVVLDGQVQHSRDDQWLWKPASERDAIAAQQAWVKDFVQGNAVDKEEDLLIALPE